MEIRSVRHKGLLRFLAEDDARGLRADMVNRVRNILTALMACESVDGVRGPPGWRIHQLTGDRAGVWSFSVTGNWRLTFRLEAGAIVELDLEDYH